MNTRTKLITAIISLQFGLVSSAFAKDFINLTFEDALTGLNPSNGNGYPEWYLPPSFDRNYGPGNHFEVVNHTAHSGDHSLRFAYDGRNGFCNTCGIKVVVHKKQGHDNVDYFVADDGQDLSLEEKPMLDSNGKPVLNSNGKPIITSLPHAQPGKMVFNKTRGYAQWEVVSVGNDTAKNDKLTLKLKRPGIGSFGNGPQIFNGGDEAGIARQCGVDGIVGLENGKFVVDRRSDCDTAITWFGNLENPSPTQSNIQPSGTSIFRRVYLKTDFIDPPTGQKLNYAILGRGIPGIGADTKVLNIIPVAEFNSTTDGIEPFISGLGKFANVSIFKPDNTPALANFKFEHGIWYYIEQEYKAEGYTGNFVEGIDARGNPTGQFSVENYVGDGKGEYRIWISKSGEEPAQNNPTIEVKNVALPPIVGGEGTHMSLWGNHQHNTHSRGVWYMDDIVVSNSFNGPAPSPTRKGHFTPKSPATSK
jgi:hypothetical protein